MRPFVCVWCEPVSLGFCICAHHESATKANHTHQIMRPCPPYHEPAPLRPHPDERRGYSNSYFASSFLTIRNVSYPIAFSIFRHVQWQAVRLEEALRNLLKDTDSRMNRWCASIPHACTHTRAHNYLCIYTEIELCNVCSRNRYVTSEMRSHRGTIEISSSLSQIMPPWSQTVPNP